MYVKVEFEDVPAYPKGFPSFWVKTLFVGTLTKNYQLDALLNTYIRVVEAALIEYVFAGENLRDFWNDHGSFKIGAISRSVSHFENCLSDMYRATNCFRRIRRHKARHPISIALNAENVDFATDAAFERLRLIRNEIIHAEEAVMDGRIKQGDPVGLLPSGPETPHVSEPHQTVKTIDRLVIGSRELLFSELAEALREMARLAQVIATFPVGSSPQSP